MSAPVRRRARGFTLIEVLVALAVMATLAAMAWRGVDGIVRTRAVTQERMEQTLRLNTVLGQFEQDLQALQESVNVPGLAFDGATLRLTRRADTGMQVVTWSLRPDRTGSGNSWQRWASPPVRTSAELQETWLRTQQFEGSEPGQLRALPGLAQWQVFCYRQRALTNCQSTGDIVVTQPAAAASDASAPGGAASAPVVVRQQIADGVRVVLQFASPELTGTLTREIAIGP